MGGAKGSLGVETREIKTDRQIEKEQDRERGRRGGEIGGKGKEEGRGRGRRGRGEMWREELLCATEGRPGGRGW